ncbi:hypothetical protein C0J52_23050 [Blattella germanica]|nr:hypothetical protein C0J52_23050 [Blattella germanica]
MVDMSEIQVSRAVVLREQGWTYRQIAADLNFSVSVMYRAIKRHRETGLYKRRHGQGIKLLTFLKENGFSYTGAMRENRVSKDCPISSSAVMKKKKREVLNWIRVWTSCCHEKHESQLPRFRFVRGKRVMGVPFSTDPEDIVLPPMKGYGMVMLTDKTLACLLPVSLFVSPSLRSCLVSNL